MHKEMYERYTDDLEQWKLWFDKWNVKYHIVDNDNERCLMLTDNQREYADVVFDLNNNFICIDCGVKR